MVLKLVVGQMYGKVAFVSSQEPCFRVRSGLRKCQHYPKCDITRNMVMSDKPGVAVIANKPGHLLVVLTNCKLRVRHLLGGDKLPPDIPLFVPVKYNVLVQTLAMDE